MKNLKIKNKLIKLLIASEIVLIISGTTGIIKTFGASKPKNLKNNQAQSDIVVIDPTADYSEAQSMGSSFSVDASANTEVNNQEQTATGVVTFTENITKLSNDVVLRSNYGYVLEGGINDIICFDQEFQIRGIYGRAVSLTELNMRKGPGTNYEQVMTINNGNLMGIYGRTSDNWYLVNYNGIVGFVSGTYIHLLDANYDEVNNIIYSVQPTVELAIQPTTLLNVRSGNSTDYSKLGLISGNRKYKVIEKCSNGWYHINYNGKDGYVSGDYVTETYMLFGDFYRFVYLKNDSYLYDGEGLQKRLVSKYEGGKVYSEDENSYFVSLGDDLGYIKKSDCKIIEGKVINIDLSLQQLEIISDGKVILTTDIISGKDSTPSDQGFFKIYDIRRDTYLKGPGYNTHVNYFGPFNGGEGIHDANWQRGNFGDVDYYHKGGSHGCINMPPEITPEVFNNVNKGTLVLVHK